MKLRIRSMATKETQRITISDAASLLELKTLIASTPAFSSSSNLNPDSIHVSLNRSDELVSPNPSDSLKELGVTTGDLLFFSLFPFTQNTGNRNSDVGASNSVKIEISSEKSASLREQNVIRSDNLNPTNRSIERMEIDSESSISNMSESKPRLIPESLVILMDSEKNDYAGILGQVIITTHAALLDSGFILPNGSGSNLPQNWSSRASSLDLKYTIPGLVDQAHAFNDKLVTLKFSTDGSYTTIYGYLNNEPDFHRVCVDLGKLAILLSSNLDSMNEIDQKRFLQFFRVLKDGICLPLMIDLCTKNNLPLPPCFMGLSADIKTKILDLISGADVARVGSTCTELNNLSLDDNLWKQKLLHDFGNQSADISTTSATISVKEKYKRAYVAKRDRIRNANSKRDMFARRPVWRGNGYLGPGRPGFSMIGGDYDRYTNIGPGRRMRLSPHGGPISPTCNFGSGRLF